MKTFLISLGGFFAVVLIIAALIIGWFIYSFVFVDARTERQVNRLDEYKTLREGVVVTESTYDGPQLIRDYGRIPSKGRDWLLQPDGTIEPGIRVFDGDEAVAVRRLPMVYTPEPATEPGEVKLGYVEDWLAEDREQPPEPTAEALALIFNGRSVLTGEQNRIATELGELPEHTLDGVDFADWITPHLMVVAGGRRVDGIVSNPLYQLRYPELTAHKIADDLYYLFSKTPDVYRFSEQGATVMVYFTGSLMWGFGGDVNKPEQSVIRVYNATWPEGQDIAQFSFKAGTVRGIGYQQGKLTVVTDSTRPSGVKQHEIRKPRQWQIAF